MTLGDKAILAEIEKGNICIDPFNSENLKTSSYDVSLGDCYFRERRPDNYVHLYNIYNKEHVERVWGKEHYQAEKASKILKHFDFKGIAPEDRVILLEPGETILAHTNEFIGGRGTITTMMKARSSLGRNFIEVCKCAGWGDVGYVNRWTMEITNNSRHYTIPLVVGRRIAQIIFFDVQEITAKDYASDGKYQSVKDFTKLKKGWNPQMMLPRLYLDREARG